MLCCRSDEDRENIPQIPLQICLINAGADRKYVWTTLRGWMVKFHYLNAMKWNGQVRRIIRAYNHGLSPTSSIISMLFTCVTAPQKPFGLIVRYVPGFYYKNKDEQFFLHSCLTEEYINWVYQSNLNRIVNLFMTLNK